MPSYSTLQTLAFGIAIAAPYVHATVVVPYLVYIDGPYGIPNDLVRYEVDETQELTMYQGRVGVHLAIGTPPQHVFVPPHFYDTNTFVRSVDVCNNSVSTYIDQCESINSGVFAANESSTFDEGSTQTVNETSGTDVVNIFDAVPDLSNQEYPFTILNTNESNFMGEGWGTLGLGPNSTFFRTFFPEKQQVGLFWDGGNSTHGKPAHSYPPRPLVIYELEFDGYNQSHYTGEQYKIPIGEPLPESGTTNPFVITVSGLKIGDKDLLADDGPYAATVDFLGRVPTVLPASIFERFAEATGGNTSDYNGQAEYKFSELPKNPANWYNLTITFENGYSVTIPQNFLILNIPDDPEDWAISTIMSEQKSQTLKPFEGPIIGLDSLLLSSYLGIDHEAGEWWLAKAVHSWDEPAEGDQAEPKENAAAGGIGDNLRKEYRVLASAAALAAAFFLFC